MMHGEKDTSAPVESSRLVVREFKKLGKTNLKYYEYKNGDHSFNGDFNLVMKIMEEWFGESKKAA
jgi:dipeptidyl aminopeptidase/acylaminoacyl peptidase